MTQANHNHNPEMSRRQLYRSPDGWIFGVCAGIAEYAQLPRFWIRLAVIIASILTSFFPIIILYVAAAIFMRPAPPISPESEDEAEFYNSLSSNRGLGIDRIRRRIEGLERRTERMEAAATTRERQWEQRLGL